MANSLKTVQKITIRVMRFKGQAEEFKGFLRSSFELYTLLGEHIAHLLTPYGVFVQEHYENVQNAIFQNS